MCISLFSLHQDEQYVVQYCLNAFWPTLSTAEEMLNYAANRFPSAHIHSALAKLATFYSLYGSDKFKYVFLTSPCMHGLGLNGEKFSKLKRHSKYQYVADCL